jgi:hypothetical protein
MLDGLGEALRRVAVELRPVSQSAFISLAKISNDLGIDVELNIYTDGRVREAQSEVATSQPKIIVYRRGNANGVLPVTPKTEHLLSPRERFSVAHELGHVLAYKHFNVRPVLKQKNSREYYTQESCMDEFATVLLVPDWLARRWLGDAPKLEAISLRSVENWASKYCGVSRAVIARGLARVDPHIGFMKLGEGTRIAGGDRLFIVYDSVRGASLSLPRQHSFIDDQLVMSKIIKSSGSCTIHAAHLGEATSGNLSVAWRASRVSTANNRKEFSSTVKLSGHGYWLSIRSRANEAERTPDQGEQLDLGL